jgi:adenylate cyclase
MRASPLGRQLGLGRTRVGIETGPAIVGDVGGSRKLDYTAHGNAVNAAARLEAANKDFGSSICIGPGTAARLDPASLHPIGKLVPRGQSHEVTVYTPVQISTARPTAG